MYSELLGVIRVTTARISIGTEHDLLDVVAMGLPKHHRRPAAAPPLRPPTFLGFDCIPQGREPGAPVPTVRSSKSSHYPFKAPSPYGATIPATILRLTEY